jgi:hypothetical protein
VSDLVRTREQLNADFARLRKVVGGDSQFMSAHGIKKHRTALPRRIPEWTANNEAVRHFLLTMFPVMRFHALYGWDGMKRRIARMPRRQRERAHREVAKALYVNHVLYSIFRRRLTESETAQEVAPPTKRKNKQDAVRDALKTIKRHG